MGTLDGWNDSLHAGQLISGIDGLIVLDGKHMTSASCCQIGVHWSDARVIQTGTDGEGFFYLTIFCLHHQGAGTVDDSLCTAMHGGSGIVGIDAMTGSLSQINLNTIIINVMIDGTCGVTSATHAGDEIIRIIATDFLLQLPFQFLADDALHLCHDIRVRMRTHGGTYDIEGILWVTAPVADGLRAGIAQSHIAGANRVHLGAQHLHTFYVGMLALHIGGTHEDFALHIHQGADGGSGNAMLSGTGFGDDTGLSHLLRHQNLSDGVIDFVCTGMVQVLTLQIELAAILLAHALGIIER